MRQSYQLMYVIVPSIKLVRAPTLLKTVSLLCDQTSAHVLTASWVKTVKLTSMNVHKMIHAGCLSRKVIDLKVR
eukprot:COSAG02_NODE_971_length_15551_cov_4.415157_15_plen_74_part_00